MASNPPGQCCTIGVKHEGEPQGKMATISGTETYVAKPSKSHQGKAILMLTDVIGHRFNNSQLVADHFAENGYLTHAPDMFKGDPIPLNRPADFDIQKWFGGEAAGGKGPGHGPDEIDPIVKAAIDHLREKEGITKLGIVGYCIGAKYVVRHMDKALAGKGADVGYCAHPSFVEDEELLKINGPLSIAAAEIDSMFSTEKRHHSEEVLAKIGQPWQINLFSGVEHGFALRGDVSKPSVKFAKEQAFFQAVQWFDQYL